MEENKKLNPLDRDERTTDIVSLRQLLSGQYVFRVPDYQRGYAWNNEFYVMWQDIMRLHRTVNRKHYTGMLALEEINDESIKLFENINGTTSFYIVDGQQRITSLVIILKSLIDYIKDEIPDKDMAEFDQLLIVNNVIYRFGYVRDRQVEAQYFEERIFKNYTGLFPSDMYLSNINTAKEFIDKELNCVSG